MPYDPARDIAPVILTNKGPMMAVVKNDSPFNTLQDLIGGQVDFMLDRAASAAAQMASGNVKVLAVTTRRRAQVAPGIATMDESAIPGLKGFDVYGWVGVFAPTGRPPNIVSRLNSEFAHALKDAQVIRTATTAGQVMAEANTPQQFRDFLQADLARWSALARRLNLETKE